MNEPLDILKQQEIQPTRPVQVGICPLKQQRRKLLDAAGRYVQRNRLVGPLSDEELQRHARAIITQEQLSETYVKFAAILVNNSVWRERLAGVPYSRRLLLLPKCLRHETACPAKVDEYGLVCELCGRCVINELQIEAERLGYVVMVAEGSPMVMALIESGQIEAVVGVSCLSVLEEVFPYMEAAAVPGIAIPLLQGDCKNTSVDLDWVWDAILLTGDDEIRTLDLEALRRKVDEWFEFDRLGQTLGTTQSQTEKIAHQWLAKSGKRWRPFLTCCIYQALQQDPAAELPEHLHKLAVAVECFHKASLIHDDIEDGDGHRYDEKTLHEEYGIPIALNVGDFLLGEGYRLIAELDVPPEQKNRMLSIAAHAHRTLCLGQGAELCWLRDKKPLAPAEVCKIFSQKTAPAFEVALQLGAIYADAKKCLCDILPLYSQALGIAYQIQDDLADANLDDPVLSVSNNPAVSDPPQDESSVWQQAMKPSLILALAYERADAGDKEILKKLWQNDAEHITSDQVNAILTKLEVPHITQELLASYKHQAIQTLNTLDNPNVKGMLRRVIAKIFHDIEIMPCCNDQN
jgi:geranylgeranyl pyrophosphate synthase